MPYSKKSDLPDNVKNVLPSDAQNIYMKAYNAALNQFSDDESKAAKVAWSAVKNAGYEKDGDSYVKKGRKRISTIIKVADIEQEQGRVFGWAYVSKNGAGVEMVDHSGQSAEIEEVENAFYEFNKLAQRPGGEMHLVEDGTMIECMVFTKDKWRALGIDPEGQPLGAWVGFEFDTTSDIWKGIKDGTYTMFSIEGTAMEEFIDAA